jgi:predicted DNA-binding transcriptional regulator AlpA
VKQDLEEVSEQLLVDAVTTCKLLSISISTLHALKRTDRLPDPIYLGRSVRWNLEELRAWVNCGCPAKHRWEAMRQHHVFGQAAKRK